MTKRERVEGIENGKRMVERMTIENKLDDLRDNTARLASAEVRVDMLRDRKWILVEELKALGHDFTTTCEGMDVVLSAPPSMRF
jgi:hypothetical protein|tara:strand:+ start:347 stop:598 length:252 start_codon:yes stop_codon:yes gene_type:complete